MYFMHIWGGGGLLEKGGSFERGSLFNLAKKMVSVLHKELDAKLKSKAESATRSYTVAIDSWQSWLINTIFSPEKRGLEQKIYGMCSNSQGGLLDGLLQRPPGLKRSGRSGLESEMTVVHDRFLECSNHCYFGWALLGGGGRFFFGRWSHIACARPSDGRDVAKTSQAEIRRTWFGKVTGGGKRGVPSLSPAPRSFRISFHDLCTLLT